MVIAFLLPQEGTKPIGGFKVVYEYANHLARRGHTVYVVHCATVFLDDSPVSLKDRLKITRYFSLAWGGKWKPSQWFPVDPAVKLTWIPTLSRHFLPKADIYIATWWATAQFLGTERLPGRKLYLIQHLETWFGSEDKVLASWKAPLEKVVIARWLQDFGKEIGESSHYIPNGLDFTKFGYDVPFESRKPDHVSMLFHEVLKWKGTSDGLAAILELKKLVPTLTAEFFGVYEPEAKLPDWITFHRNPSQPDLRAIYNRSSLFLAPSHSEGWGLPPCEAMICGAAVVATDIGGHREFCIDRETALLVPASDTKKMTEALYQLIVDSAFRARIATQGRQNIQRFTWESSTNLLEELLLR